MGGWVQLTAGEQAALRRRAIGNGGFQILVRDLQKRLRPDGSIYLVPTDIERIRKACRHDGGSGGFEGQIGKPFGRALAEHLDRKGPLL